MSAVKPKANNQGKKVVKINDKNSASSSTSTPKQSEKIKKLQDEITELTAKLNMYQYHMDPIKLEEKFGIPEDSLVNMLRNENAQLRLELAKFTSGITIKSEINKLEKDIKQLQNNNDDLKQIQLEEKLGISEESLINMLRNEITQLRTELAKCTSENTVKSNDKELREKLEKSEKEKEKQAVELSQKDNKITKLNKQIQKMESLESVRKMEIAQNRQTREQLKVKETQVEAMKTSSANTDISNIQSLKREKESIEKLSKVVGVNIVNDNPSITDLSDENRPTKLSEKLSELFDNEWTDAYEEAEKEFKTEEKGIAHLYKTLQDISDFCKKKSVEHEENIRNSIMTLPNSSGARPKSAKIGAINQHQLKEVRKSFAPMLVESVFQNYVYEKKLNFTKKENIGKFIKKCVEICWLMNSQNPPVIFDTSDVDGKSFDVDKFRTYTKTGKLVDYVVWPPMLLHKGGPMLCKGVAQGK